ncbi:MAG TPA: sulfur transferase domain-containing protein [Vicinamibacteria bacterium]|jgi:uncharacterized protein (TIGR01244 family)
MVEEAPVGYRVPVTLMAVAAAAAVMAAEIPRDMDAAAVPNYRVVRKGVAAGGTPSAAALAGLTALGFRTVIDLRTAQEGTAEEKAAATAAGLRYVGVPVTPATFRLEDVLEVAKVLDDPSALPVLVHCSSSNRVGAVWAVLRAREGADREQALREGEAAGLKSEAMREAVRRVLDGPPPVP